ncbi:MaoC/PaaZ C-terminal domain-containing protein [Polycladomyces subterraneus]|uniref:MaoC/PaaZ C-terminal domain-containing protein n=1 Tax=Polycladomyces subterraneus TaxID=1016997 RepID=A0ABT8IJY2_9BACL|nr:MaoC/PaaZ C-terminal domain-containing protein [Polycladomyces subterraneus]MDN4593053.1 MaoC/PaaZ C-terminal domain-containing protein [Polycladomyces subterraneus]
MFDKYFEDYEIGEKWRSTRGRTITEADIVNFASFSGDWYPLHTDAEWAEKSPFRRRIAHGMLVLSAATGLNKMEPGYIAAFYGMDQVRFTAPTFIGDTIYVENEVVEKTDKGKHGVVTLCSAVKKQTGETAAVSIMKVLMYKRP